MSLQDLRWSTPNTVINVLSRFLVAKGVIMQFIGATLLIDMSGARFVKLMDRFAMHLTSAERRGGKALARNSAMSYFLHVKNWLLDPYSKNRVSIENKFLKMVQTLERRCLKRLEDGATKRAPACTKEDLRILIDGLYFVLPARRTTKALRSLP
ncbi:hypothetical protein PHMEG_00010948 [Phytophthora megakarya]|uniref:Uncharacterized protein n=1 Tax=Phytophthora megakarya TaxID=4795 RepID=A0A225WEW7_9STRA|nr:hypothetical protein PHMEG_00010948 [Phytophthora megakarya]